ncbi:MAG: hypothetical protein HYX72_03375 [Acidobacteria bacterium]|nr:hypothetical protein [Acidobacteriota bacterium]
MAMHRTTGAKKSSTPRLAVDKEITPNHPVPPGGSGRRKAATPPGDSPLPPSDSEPLLNLAGEGTISVREAAFRLCKSEGAVRKWLRRGRLKGWQVGGSHCTVLVSEASVEEALRRVKVFGT